MHPRRLNRIEPGTCAREAADHHATAPVLFGLTIVALDPGCPPGGRARRPGPSGARVPCAGGGHVGGKPGQPGPGDRADGTPVDNASPPGGGRGHRAPSQAMAWPAGPGPARGVPPGGQARRRSQQASGAGPHDSTRRPLNAQGAVRRVGGDPEQPIAWRVLHASAGSGLTIRVSRVSR